MRIAQLPCDTPYKWFSILLTSTLEADFTTLIAVAYLLVIKARGYNVYDRGTKGLKLNESDYIVGKRNAEKGTSFVFGDTALLHVEESLLVELPCSHTMATLYIIRINLKLRLGVDASIGRE